MNFHWRVLCISPNLKPLLNKNLINFSFLPKQQPYLIFMLLNSGAICQLLYKNVPVWSCHIWIAEKSDFWVNTTSTGNEASTISLMYGTNLLPYLLWQNTLSNIYLANLKIFNPSLANVSILYSLKTAENICFSGVFRGYKLRSSWRNGLKQLDNT